MVSKDYGTRSVATGEVSKARYNFYDEITLTENTNKLWEELVRNNFETLESNYHARSR